MKPLNRTWFGIRLLFLLLRFIISFNVFLIGILDKVVKNLKIPSYKVHNSLKTKCKSWNFQYFKANPLFFFIRIQIYINKIEEEGYKKYSTSNNRRPIKLVRTWQNKFEGKANPFATRSSFAFYHLWFLRISEMIVHENLNFILETKIKERLNW